MTENYAFRVRRRDSKVAEYYTVGMEVGSTIDRGTVRRDELFNIVNTATVQDDLDKRGSHDDAVART